MKQWANRDSRTPQSVRASVRRDYCKQVSSSLLPIRTEIRVFPLTEYKHSLRRLSEHQPIRFLPESKRRGMSRVCFLLGMWTPTPTQAVSVPWCSLIGKRWASFSFLPSWSGRQAACGPGYRQVSWGGCCFSFNTEQVDDLPDFLRVLLLFFPHKTEVKACFEHTTVLWGNLAKENSKENGIFHSNWYFSETDLGFGEFKCRCV